MFATPRNKLSRFKQEKIELRKQSQGNYFYENLYKFEKTLFEGFYQLAGVVFCWIIPESIRKRSD